MLQPQISWNECVSDRTQPGLKACRGWGSLAQAARRRGVFGVQCEIVEKVDQGVHLVRVSQRVLRLGGGEVLQSSEKGADAPAMLTKSSNHRVVEVQQLLGCRRQLGRGTVAKGF